MGYSISLSALLLHCSPTIYLVFHFFPFPRIIKLSFPSLLTMKYSHLIFLCVLFATTFLYFFSITLNPPFSCSSPSSIYLQGRRSVTQLRVLSSNRKFANKKIKGVYDKTKQSTTQEESTEAVKYASGGENLDEQLVYHIDYHGVTTHPAPTIPKYPKHPKP